MGYLSKIYIGLSVMVIQLVSAISHAEVLELGASELHGKKDQPEAMTFVSRAHMGETTEPVVWNGLQDIKQEIADDIFVYP